MLHKVSGGSSRVRRSSLEPPPLFSSVETLYHITSSVVLPWLNIARYLFAIHSKHITRYPLVSVDQVRYCGELLFFSSSFFFFFPHFFFFFPLSIFKSWDGFSPWKSPLFTYHSFFFFPSFPPLLHSFFPSFFFPTLISSSHFPPTFHFILFPFLFSSVNLSMFFFLPQYNISQHSSQFLDHR